MLDETNIDDGLELKRLEIEKRKLEIEERKAEIENLKVKWAAISIAVTMLAALGTIAYGVYSIGQQAKLTFQLEAAKTVMASKNTAGAITQANFLRDVFSDNLPPKFLSKLDLRDFPDAPNVEAKWEFLTLVSSRGLKPDQTAQFYRVLFPDDKWADTAAINDLLAKTSVQAESLK
jgi:hypothetical protein